MNSSTLHLVCNPEAYETREMIDFLQENGYDVILLDDQNLENSVGIEIFILLCTRGYDPNLILRHMTASMQAGDKNAKVIFCKFFGGKAPDFFTMKPLDFAADQTRARENLLEMLKRL